MESSDIFEKLRLQALEKKRLRDEELSRAPIPDGDDAPPEQPEQPEEIKPEISVEVSSDRLKAEIELLAPSSGKDVTDFPSRDELIAAVTAEKVIHGINDEIYDLILKERVLRKRYLVAQGAPAQRGKDGYIEYLVDTDRTLKPRIMEDGTVDFKNLGYALVVTKGQRLCRVVQPTKGQDGMDVFGNVLDGAIGSAVIPPTGRGTDMDEQGEYLIATCDGNLNIIRNSMNIDEELKINGSIDNSTGSINFPGNVIIYGDVLEGFEVISGANIIIRGFVEGATIRAEGNITLHGVNGMGRGLISAGESLKCSYIESATVICGGDISADTILNSIIKCKGNVTLSGRKGTLIGGECTVYGSLSAKNIGTVTHTPTCIILGSEYDNIRLLSENQQALDEITEQIVEIDKNITRLAPLIRSGHVREQKMHAFYCMIEERKRLIGERDAIQEKVDKLSDCLNGGGIHELSILECSGTMHTGVNLRVSRTVLEISASYSNCRAYLDDGDIKISV